MTNQISNQYETDPNLHCLTDCPDERMTAKCIRASYRQLNNGGENVNGDSVEVQYKCDIGPVRFLGEILCGSTIDPVSLK